MNGFGNDFPSSPSQITYPCRMSDTRAALLIALVWILASAISFPAILWWRAVADAPPPAWSCPFTEDTGYLVFSSTVSFYGPLTVMVFTYARIYRVAAAHQRSMEAGAKKLGGSGGGELRIHRGGASAAASSAGVAAALASSTASFRGGNSSPASRRTSGDRSQNGVQRGHSTLSKRMKVFAKEKKAAKTLGTVMGVFIICWLPFFVTNVVSGLCPRCIFDPAVFQVVTWLGWINSGMNPVIYACCSRDFRR